MKKFLNFLLIIIVITSILTISFSVSADTYLSEEKAKELVLDYFYANSSLEGDYAIFDEETTVTADKYFFLVRYQGTEENSYPNVLHGIAEVRRITGEMFLDGAYVCNFWKTIAEETPYSDLLNGDFSSVSGLYINSLGEETTLLDNGLEKWSEEDNSFDYRVTNTTKLHNGSYTWSVVPYYNDIPYGGYGIIIYPEGVEVIAYDGSIVQTDTTKIRLWCGNGVVSDSQHIYYRQPTSTENRIKVVLDNNEITFDQQPIMINDRIMVPVRAIFEAMGATVEWRENTQTVLSKKGSTTIYIKIGDYCIYKNGAKLQFDVPTQIINGRTLAPVRAVAEAFGAKVTWDDSSQTAYIDTSAKINAVIINADEEITSNDAALVRSVLLNNKLAKVNEENFHNRFEPSQEELNMIFNAAIIQAGESDITYFYYSGHGKQNGSICPLYNNQTKNLSYSLSPQELINTLKKIPGTIVVILDSCYSGAINNLSNLDCDKFKILTASEASTFSNSSDLALISSEQIGFFTEALLNGLGGLEGGNIIYNTITGRDGKVKADYNSDRNVTLAELFNYIDENMEKKYRDKNGNIYYQNPTCSNQFDDTVIFSY